MTPHTTLTATVALTAALCSLPAVAQSNAADLQKEIQDLKAKLTDLEKKAGGLSAEQAKELNKVTVKAEALEDSRDEMGFKNLKVSGYMDPVFLVNKAQNRSGMQFLNNVSDDGYHYDNSYFGGASIDFQKETDSGTKWRLTLSPNRGVGNVFNGESPVHEASVSVPLSDDTTRLLAGQIPDWSGYEYLQPTLNKFITHNLLFDFTLPVAYTGAGIELTRGNLTLKSILGNMNTSKKTSGNKSPMVAVRGDYSMGEFSGVGFAGVVGKAANFRDESGADSGLALFEVDGYHTRGDWTFGGQLSYGMQKKAAITAGVDADGNEFLRDAKWFGASATVGYKMTPRLEALVRADFINNKKNGGGLLGYVGADGRNGIGPGITGIDADGIYTHDDAETGTNRSAVSLGLHYSLNENTALKAEYRMDRASQAVFENLKDGTFGKSNNLLGLAVVVSF